MNEPMNLDRPSITVNESISLFHHMIGALPGTGGFALVLFGSRARGDANCDSDIDMLVLTRAVSPELDRSLQAMASAVFAGHRYVVNLLTDVQLEQFLRAGDVFAWTVVSKGLEVGGPSPLLAQLRETLQAIQLDETCLRRDAVVAYLREKSLSCLANVRYWSSLVSTNLSLAAMAAAQAEVLRRNAGDRIDSRSLIETAEWTTLRNLLVAYGYASPTLERIEAFARPRPDGRLEALLDDARELLSALGIEPHNRL